MPQNRHRTSRDFVLGCCALALVLVPADAAAEPHAGSAARGQIQVKVRPDGTKLFYNETPKQRARRQSARLHDPDPELAHWIEFYARRQNLNPRLVQAVVQVESGYNPLALSRKGAMGLMQLMPDTARLLGVGDPYDPVQNLRGGTRYLKQQLQRFPNLSLALAAYNAGPTTVARYDGMPPYRETREYVRKVLGLLGLSRPPSTAARGPVAAAQGAGPDRADASATGASTGTTVPRRVRGRQVFVSRGENDRISFTTAPPKQR